MYQATFCLPEYSLDKSYFQCEKNTFVCLSLLYFTELSTATVDEPPGQDLCRYAHRLNELPNTIPCDLDLPDSQLKYYQCWELKFWQFVNSFNSSTVAVLALSKRQKQTLPSTKNSSWPAATVQTWVPVEKMQKDQIPHRIRCPKASTQPSS